MIELLGTLLNKIAESGIVGVFCAIFMIVSGFLGRALLKAKDQAVDDQKLRLDDQKAYTKALTEGNAATQKLVLEVKEWTSDLMVKHVQELGEVKTAMNNQARELDEMEEQHRKAGEKHEKMQTEFSGLTAAINQCTKRG